MRFHRLDLTKSSKADSTPPVQQFGSKTCASTPFARKTPAKRQTPSGGARKVYSPQCGSYGPTSKYLSGPELGKAARAHSMTPPNPWFHVPSAGQTNRVQRAVLRYITLHPGL